MTTMEERFDRLDAEMARLTERLTELAVGERLLAERTEATRTNLRERMDVLESFLGQTIDHLQDHTRNPEARDELEED